MRVAHFHEETFLCTFSWRRHPRLASSRLYPNWPDSPGFGKGNIKIGLTPSDTSDILSIPRKQHFPELQTELQIPVTNLTFPRNKIPTKYSDCGLIADYCSKMNQLAEVTRARVGNLEII